MAARLGRTARQRTGLGHQRAGTPEALQALSEGRGPLRLAALVCVFRGHKPTTHTYVVAHDCPPYKGRLVLRMCVRCFTYVNLYEKETVKP